MSMHKVIIEKALHWVVRVLQVVDTTEREVSAYEGEVKCRGRAIDDKKEDHKDHGGWCSPRSSDIISTRGV